MFLFLLIATLMVAVLFLVGLIWWIQFNFAPIVEPPPREGEEESLQSFSSSYFEARKKFRAAAKAAGAQLSSHLVHMDDVTGLELTIDIAVIKGNNPKNVFISQSATHGVEGYAGSAIQIEALKNHAASSGSAQQQNPNFPTIIFVHAVNPSGMANFRRFNENNVDLNRNCFGEDSELDKLTARDPDQFMFETLSKNFFKQAPSSISFWGLITFLPRMIPILLRFGVSKIKTALVTGQYHDPKAIWYGGNEVQKSWRLIREALMPHVSQAKRLVAIDIHSGLGPCGVDSMMPGPAEKAMCSEIFGKSSPYAPLISSHDGDKGAGEGYQHMRGGFDIVDLCGFRSQAATKFEFEMSVAQEFGTLPSVLVAMSVIMENSAFQTVRGSPAHRMTQELSRKAFYVESKAWKNQVIHRGLERLQQSVDFIINK